MFLTYDADEIYKHTNVNRFDGPMGGNGKTSSGGVPKNDVTRSMLIVIDAQTARDHFQILDPPIARMRCILATSLPHLTHGHGITCGTTSVSMSAYPFCRLSLFCPPFCPRVFADTFP
jgi:hypothetical protein